MFRAAATPPFFSLKYLKLEIATLRAEHKIWGNSAVNPELIVLSRAGVPG